MSSRPKPTLEEIRALPNAALLARYAKGIENFDRRMFLLTDAQLDTAFLPEAEIGRWPVRVLLGHLADAELVFTHRLRRTVGEDSPVFALWDENAFIDAGIYQQNAAPGATAAGGGSEPIAAYVAVIHTLRRWMAGWIAGLPEDAWSRRALHPERGEMTFRLILEYATWHIEHHAWFLYAKLDAMLGPPRPPE